jgi:hypothetical protein
VREVRGGEVGWDVEICGRVAEVWGEKPDAIFHPFFKGVQ